ncbi:hypothetical protein Syun_019206 [Stephania yunnanensis]|uniref:Uncharacterized protein n=1 Tax=Stephania yunnanensis TaxID=152371 RepID=A0AAP0ITQ2_9MAGN
MDVFQLARLCDAPDLYLKCMNLVLREEKAKFLQDNDPYFELEILRFLEEIESAKLQRIRQEVTQTTPDQPVDDEAVYYKVVGECSEGRVYGLWSLGRKKRRYTDPDASTSQHPQGIVGGGAGDGAAGLATSKYFSQSFSLVNAMSCRLLSRITLQNVAENLQCD